jgi:iron complex outermembrane receptor protein
MRSCPSRRSPQSHRPKVSSLFVNLMLVAAAVVGITSVPRPAVAAAIEEILVTARKREERLIDSPVAVSALQQEEVERYYTRDLAQLSTRIPGVQIAHAAGGGAGGSMFIRGVGNLAVDYGADQPVSLVLDGMSFQRGHVLDTGFFDVQSVEVLKGPQALFFGKNSPAGVIAVESVSPVIGAPMEGFVRGAYEFETEDPVVEAGISWSAGDQWAFRIAGRRQDMQGGFLKNTARPINDNPLTPGAPDGNPTHYLGEPTRGASYDDFPGQEQDVVRFTTVWEPTDTFAANLKIFYSDSKQNDAGNTVLYACADGPGAHPYYLGFPDLTQTCPDKEPKLKRNGALPPASVANNAPGLDASKDFYNKLNNAIQTLELTWDVNDEFTLTSVSAHWDYRHREYTNYDYTSYAVVVSEQGESGESWTQELRLQSGFDGPLNFMVGAFYEDMERDLNAPVQILPNSFFPHATDPSDPLFPVSIPNTDPSSPYYGSSINYHQRWDNNIESWSAFGSVDWDINDQLTLSGGARYSHEERDSFGGNLYQRGLGFSPSGYFYSPSDEDNNLSPEVTLSWRPMEDVMTYLSWKTGYQSFGISNPGTVPDLCRPATPGGPCTVAQSVVNDYFIFDETKVDGFELGLKGYFLDQSIQAELSVYAFEYDDLQVAVFDSVTTTFSTQNAGVATNTGIDVNATWQATDELQLRIAGLYTWLEFDEFEDAQCFTAQTVALGCVTDPVTGARTQDLSGERYGGPPLQVNVGASYDFMLNPQWGLEFTADVIHHNEGYETRNQPDTDIDARTVTNLAARLYQEAGPWELSLVCSNCTDEIYVTGIGDKPLGRAAAPGQVDLTGFIANPRLVTLQATYRLGEL